MTFLGVKTYSDPSYIFSGGQDPQPPRIYTSDRHVELPLQQFPNVLVEQLVGYLASVMVAMESGLIKQKPRGKDGVRERICRAFIVDLIRLIVKPF